MGSSEIERRLTSEPAEKWRVTVRGELGLGLVMVKPSCCCPEETAAGELIVETALVLDESGLVVNVV